MVGALIVLGRQAGAYVPRFAEWVDGLGPAGPLVFIVGYAIAVVAFVPGSVLTLAAGAPVRQTDGSWETAVTAWLLNAEQNPVAGVPVVFTTDSGAITSPVDTDAMGIAQAVLYHPDVLPPGATVTAAFGELTHQLDIQFNLPLPATILLMAEPASLPLGW